MSLYLIRTLVMFQAWLTDPAKARDERQRQRRAGDRDRRRRPPRAAVVAAIAFAQGQAALLG